MRVLLALACVAAVGANPIAKVVELLQGMRTTISNEINEAQKTYVEYQEWSRSTIQETEHAITRNTEQQQAAEAGMSDSAAKIQEHEGNIQDLSGSIATNEKDLAGAKEIREKQKADFQAAEKDLVDTIDTLVRAASLLRQHGGRAGSSQLQAALTQVSGMLSTVLDAAFVNGMDKQRLQALLQAKEDGDDDDSDDDKPKFTNPTAAAYTSHSGNIIDILAELKVKAESELNTLRKEEMGRQHEFDLLQQSLTDSISVGNRDLDTNKAGLSEQREINAKMTGEKEEQAKQLADNTKYLEELQQQKTDKAQDHETSQASRREEVKAVDEAIAILSGKDFQGAVGRRAFVQVKEKDPRARVMDLLKSAAREFHSVGLAQLALRASEDPFAKVKQLIEQMIARLNKQSAEEASKKAYCDEEMKKTTAKRDEQSGKLDNFSSRLEKANADHAMLKEDVATLSGEISELDAKVSEATKIRQSESAEFAAAQADYSTGLEGLNQALEVLRKFYAEKATKVSKSESSTGVIAMLETAEADMTRLQAESKMEEDTAAKDFAKFTQESKVTRASKEAAMKGKEQEGARLAASIADLKNDVDGMTAELDATLKYLDKLRQSCTHKPQTFAERAANLQKEIESLHEALRILNEETAAGAEEGEAFLQRK
jgi:hypothetical protein